jgi:uncharacterized pyridoxamine 5'-phosphate oxidase family protein
LPALIVLATFYTQAQLKEGFYIDINAIEGEIMDRHAMMAKVVELLDNSNVGILATAELEGQPSVRWMVPAVLKGRANALFCLTSPKMGQFIAEKCHPHVTWMIQTINLDRVLTLHGKINVIDNPSLKMEVLSIIGNRIHNFWKLDNAPDDFVVLETVLENGSYYVPLKGSTEKVTFE